MAAAGVTVPDLPAGSTFDPQTTDRVWSEAVDELLADWVPLTADQREAVAEQVTVAVERADPASLADLRVPDDETTFALYAALVALFLTAAGLAVIEALGQGVAIPGVEPDGWARRRWADGKPNDDDRETLAGLFLTFERDAWLHGWSRTTAAILAGGLGHAGAREALRVWTDPDPEAGWEDIGRNAERVAAAVDEHLTGLSDAYLKATLSGALTMAQNTGRVAVLDVAPDARYFASEHQDVNACDPCKAIDGAEYKSLADAAKDYPTGGFIACLGRLRCRGTVLAVWTVPA